MNGDAFIYQYQHIPYLPFHEEALMILRKLALSVMPIMDMYNWRIGILCEMYPSDPGLLGLNYSQGQRICVRLREPHNAAQFCSMEDIADTMLHELVHNVQGPHNDFFFALWNQLRRNYAQLIHYGYTGDFILSYGPPPGGIGIQMAEARRVVQQVAANRPSHYGGASGGAHGAFMPAGLNPQVFCADAHHNGSAVMRGCLSGLPIPNDVFANGHATMAQPSNPNQQMLMRAFGEMMRHQNGPPPPPPAPPNGTGYAPNFPFPVTPGPGGQSVSSGPPPYGNGNPVGGWRPYGPPTPHVAGMPSGGSAPIWTCPRCSRANPVIFINCEGCGAPHPGR